MQSVREKIKIVPNVPLAVTLEDEGKECRSPLTGLEYRYNVGRGNVACTLYLPPDGHAAIRRAGARPGDDVELRKNKHANGQEFWTAAIFSDATMPPPQDQHAAGIRVLAPAARQAIATTRPGRVEAAQPWTGNGTQQTQQQPTNGSARANTQSQSPQAEEIPPAALLAQCLMYAVDAAVGAEQFAAKKGKTLNFNEEEIGKLAITVYIDRKKAERGY